MGGIQSLGLVPDINDIFRTAFPEFIPELLLSHGMFAVPPQREMNAKAMLIGVIFKFRPDIHSCRVPVESVNCCQVQENGLLRTLVSLPVQHSRNAHTCLHFDLKTERGSFSYPPGNFRPGREYRIVFLRWRIREQVARISSIDKSIQTRKGVPGLPIVKGKRTIRLHPG